VLFSDAPTALRRGQPLPRRAHQAFVALQRGLEHHARVRGVARPVTDHLRVLVVQLHHRVVVLHLQLLDRVPKFALQPTDSLYHLIGLLA
jgi:hypothetical protein